MFFFHFFGESYPDNWDFDIFFADTSKLIHIATAGMELNDKLIETIQLNNSNLRKILKYRRRFPIITNYNIIRDNLTTLDSYVYFFNLMATRGFYSYDKYDINDPSDKRFQLISKPIYDRKIYLNDFLFNDNKSFSKINYNLELLNTKKDLPIEFEIFDITEYISNFS